MNKLLYILALLLITVCSAKAQNITVEVPNNIVAGESFRVLYDIAMKDVEEFMLSPLPEGIEEVMEPFPTTMDNNGKKITRYTVVLSAVRSQGDGSLTLSHTLQKQDTVYAADVL